MKTLWIALALALGLMAAPTVAEAQPRYPGYSSGISPFSTSYNYLYGPRYYGGGSYYGNSYYGNSHYGGRNYGSRTYPNSWGRSSSRYDRHDHRDNDNRWDGNRRWDSNDNSNDDRWERHQRATPSDGRWRM